MYMGNTGESPEVRDDATELGSTWKYKIDPTIASAFEKAHEQFATDLSIFKVMSAFTNTKAKDEVWLREQMLEVQKLMAHHKVTPSALPKLVEKAYSKAKTGE